MTEPATLFPRFLRGAVEAALEDTRVVVIQGARQVGKSTLARQVLEGRAGARSVTLDDPEVLAAARADPATFVRHDGPLGIDEIQRAPELLLPLKARVDRDPRPGRFLLTGSAQLLTLPRLSDALAGRLEILELWPLSQGEVGSRREGFVDRLLAGRAQQASGEPVDRDEVLRRACAGGFPEARRRRGARRAAWFDSYLKTFVSRDVRDLQDIEHTRRLRGLLALLAARVGSPLNVDDLARDARLPPSTTRRYLDLLEAAYLWTRVPAWSTNRSQRVASAPKGHLVDSALCAHLLGVEGDPPSSLGVEAGPVLETFAVGEIRKQLGWSRVRAGLHHLRTHDGQEVDVVLEAASGAVAGVEVKASRTVGERDFAGLRWLRARAGEDFTQGVVLYTGEQTLPFGPGLWALPFSSLWA